MMEKSNTSNHLGLGSTAGYFLTYTNRLPMPRSGGIYTQYNYCTLYVDIYNKIKCTAACTLVLTFTKCVKEKDLAQVNQTEEVKISSWEKKEL